MAQRPRSHSLLVQRLWKGSVASVLAQVVYLGTRLALTPVVIDSVGMEAYGLWSMLFVALGLVGLHRMGLHGATVPLVARALARSDRQEARRLLRSTASLASLLALFLGIPILVHAETVVTWMGCSSGSLPDAALCLQITAASTLAALVLGNAQSALEAGQEHPRVKGIECGAQLIEAALLVLLLLNGGGLVSLAGAYAVRLLLPIPLYIRWSSKLLGLGFSSLVPGGWKRSSELLRLGGAIQALGMLHLAIAFLPRLILAHSLGLAATAVYELARKLIDFAAALPSQALGPMVAATGRLSGAEQGEDGQRWLLLRSTSIVAVLGAMPLLVLVLSGEAIAWAWLGEGNSEIAQTILILGPAAWLHLLTGPFTATLRGMAEPKWEVAYSLTWLVLLLAGYPLASGEELGTAAVTFSLAQGLASSLLLFGACPRLGVSFRDLGRFLMLPIVALLGFVGLACQLLEMISPASWTSLSCREDGLVVLLRSSFAVTAGFGLTLASCFALARR